MSTWHPIEADSYNEGYKDGKRDVVSELRSLISTGVLATGAGIHGWEIKIIVPSRDTYLALYKLVTNRMDGKENDDAENRMCED